MPPYLPWHAELVFLSGVAEVLRGLGVLIPANIHVAVNNVPVFGATEGPGPVGYVRLLFQLVLIAWAYWYTRD